MHVKLIGIQHDPVFQQCAEACDYMKKEHEYTIDVVRNLEYQFDKERREILSSSSSSSSSENNNNNSENNNNNEISPLADESVITLVTSPETKKTTMMSGNEFIKHVVSSSDFKLFDLPNSDPDSYVSLARGSHRRFLRSTGCAFAWMLIKQGDIPLGRLTFQLFADKSPRTCQNFLYLCRGDLPDVETTEYGKVNLTYKDSRVFRVVKNGWIQAGDIVDPKKGNGGYSIYGRHFPDESFEIPHDAEGIVGMANDGEHTNASSFYITVGPSAWMNKRYVAFGRVVEGLKVLRALRDVKTKHNQSPVDDIVIADCGEISTDP